MSIERVKYIVELKDLITRPFRKIQNSGKHTFDKLDRELDQFQRNLNSTRTPIRNTQRRLQNLSVGGKGSFRGLGLAAAGAVPQLASFAGAAGVGLVAAAIVKLGAGMEQTRIAFEVMLGGAKVGNALIEELHHFANVTPFTTGVVVNSAKQLIAYGIEGNKVIDTLKTLGEISAGIGTEKLPFLIRALGDVKAATVLTGLELKQFQNNSVPLRQALADLYGTTAADVKNNLIPAGKVSYDDVMKALKSLSSEGGRFFNLMDRQSKTLSGRWSTLVGKFELFGIKLGESQNGFWKPLVEGGIAVVDWFSENFSKLGRVFAPIGEALRPIWEGFQEIGKAFGMTGGAGGFLASVFNLIGNTLRRLAPLINGFTNGIKQVLLFIAKIVKITREWASSNEWVSKTVKGIQGFFIEAIKTIVNAMSGTLKGLGTIMEGFFSYDYDKMQDGFKKLKSGVFNANPIAAGYAGVQGFKKGYNSTSTDFFGKGLNPNKLLAGGEGGDDGKVPGLGEKTNLLAGLSEVVGDGKAAKNITINIDGGLVGQIDVYAQDPRDFKDQIREKVTEALSLVLNDANIIAAQ